MDFFILFIVALAVCSDSFAVSVTVGFTAGKISKVQALGIAFVFATFQGLMPLLGWMIGYHSQGFLAGFKWFGFLLLFLVGSRMIYEGTRKSKLKSIDPLKPLVLFTLALASSVDALVVGLSTAFLDLNIFITANIIGVLTFILVLVGIWFGKNLGVRFGKNMEVLGGVILILIGLSFLILNMSYL